jgi:hypothetical protein
LTHTSPFKLAVSPLHDIQSVLEHTWLKRRLLAQLRESGDAWAHDLDLPVPRVLQGIEGRLCEARRFIGALIDLYGPAQLVDHGPLRSLPPEVRQLIKDAVENAYLRLDFIQPLSREAEAALSSFEEVFNRLPLAWNSLQCRASVLRDLALAGERLRAALAALPEGVVIP